MIGAWNILSAYLYAVFHNYKALFLKIFNFQTTDQKNINKYIIFKFNLYKATNNKDLNLWLCIQVDYEIFKAQYLDKLDSSI